MTELATGTALRDTWVYLYYDEAGRILYVGITGKGKGRASQHSNSSEWARFARRQEIEHCDDRETALRRESELIAELRPPFNRQGNPGWAELRSAYLSVVMAEEAYMRVRAGQPPNGDDCLVCSSDSNDCEPCLWGEGFPTGHELAGIGCGKVDCVICHARFHGVEEGIPAGYEAGARDRAPARPTEGPCGHCEACRINAAVPADAYAAEPCEATRCRVCGKSTCTFEAGHRLGVRVGRHEAVQEMYENGEGQRLDSMAVERRMAEAGIGDQGDWGGFTLTARSTSAASPTDSPEFAAMLASLFNTKGQV